MTTHTNRPCPWADAEGTLCVIEVPHSVHLTRWGSGALPWAYRPGLRPALWMVQTNHSAIARGMLETAGAALSKAVRELARMQGHMASSDTPAKLKYLESGMETVLGAMLTAAQAVNMPPEPRHTQTRNLRKPKP